MALSVGSALLLLHPSLATAATTPATTASGATASVTTPPTTLSAQAALAESRYAVSSEDAHAGTAETLTHPAYDGLGSAAPTTGAASSVTAPSADSSSKVLSGPSAVLGVDVSNYQGDVDWTAVADDGGQFAYVKATEGTYYVDSTYFSEQYEGSYDAGLIRGAYHFAIPDNSTGAAQADYFVANGGGWSADGKTLPGLLDIENNPYGAECYGLTQAEMVSWIESFDNEYKTLTGRYPVLYTNAPWWDDCTGGSSIADQDPLAIANYGAAPSPLPGGWSAYTIWQYTDDNTIGMDGDAYNGTSAGLEALALGTGGTGTTSALPPTTDNRLSEGKKLTAGESIVSPSGVYTVTMKADGNLVETNASGTTVWKTATSGHSDAYTQMRSDGNLSVFSTSGTVLWKSKTGSDGPSYAVIQDDGNFVVYTNAGKATWDSGVQS